MTATDELRRRLDERGIEWWSKPRLVVGGVEKGTEFDAADGSWVCAIEALDGTICVSHLTPEQAVTVTLGAGTCKDEGDPGDFCCSECGMRMFTDTNDTYMMIASDERTIIKHPNFCPNCGRKVVDE